MSTTSDMPALFGEEYQALRESVSALAQKKILPFAHDVDENSRYPQEAADALQSAGLAAAHVPVDHILCLFFGFNYGEFAIIKNPISSNFLSFG